jgi:hypothetical protein
MPSKICPTAGNKQGNSMEQSENIVKRYKKSIQGKFEAT